MAAHSLAEGVAVGSSFAAGGSFGVVTAAAIVAHKSAEGFAIGLVLVPRGVGVGSAVGWSMATALPQPIIAVPAFLFVDAFASALPLVLGLAAGAMSAVVVLELLPEACRRARASTVALAAAGAFLVTSLLQASLTL
jgi:zinc transporter ZupT